MSNIPIKLGKVFREQLGWSHFVMFGIDKNGMQHVVTHGEMKVDAKEAADFGNKLKKAAQWPENLCRDKPLERRCPNCAYCQETSGFGPHYYSCHIDQKIASVDRNRIACR